MLGINCEPGRSEASPGLTVACRCSPAGRKALRETLGAGSDVDSRSKTVGRGFGAHDRVAWTGRQYLFTCKNKLAPNYDGVSPMLSVTQAESLKLTTLTRTGRRRRRCTTTQLLVEFAAGDVCRRGFSSKPRSRWSALQVLLRRSGKLIGAPAGDGTTSYYGAQAS